MDEYKYNPDKIKSVFLFEDQILSTDIKDGDEVVRFVDRPVNSYLLKGKLSGILVFENGISCGNIERETWYKVIGNYQKL